MAMGRRKTEAQAPLFVATDDLPRTPGHPFYQKLNEILAEAEFDSFVEQLCQKSYAEEEGRPSLPPGAYMRMLLISPPLLRADPCLRPRSVGRMTRTLKKAPFSTGC